MIPYFANIRDVRIQSFHYQILHRFFPCNYILNKWYSDIKKECTYCSESDTLEHYFFNCSKLKCFWSSFFKWWFSITETQFGLHALDIVLGIQNQNNDTLINLLNYCILQAKVYIYDCKYNDKECFFYEFQTLLKNTLDSEHISYAEKGLVEQFKDTFGKVYTNL